MNILHTETLKKWGGQQNRVLTELIELHKKGYRTVLTCNTDSVLAHRAKAAGVRVYEMTMKQQSYMTIIPRLVDIIRKEKIDLVATHSSVDSWAGGLAAKMTGRRLVRFRHNVYPVGRGPLAKFIYSIPDGFIVTSNVVKDILVRRGVKANKIAVIPSSVNIERYSADAATDIRKEAGVPADAFVIGNTSTFADVKGQEYLLQAFNLIHPNAPCYLLFAGRLVEPSRSEHLSHVNSDLRGKVIFLGHRDDIPNVLKTIDIFVFPSVTESTSTALLEAMAMERPVLVSDIPALRDLITERENGMFFSVKEPRDIAEKVLLLKNDPQLRKLLGRNARKTVIEGFTTEAMIRSTEDFYRGVCRER